MIDTHLLESAKQIRRKFIRVSSQLDLYETDVRALAEFLEEKIKVLDVFVNEKIKKIKTESDYQTVTKEIIKEIEEIEDEEKKLHKKIEKINIELEKLNKEEEILYATIKQKYPELKDDQLVRYIHKNL